MSEVSVEEKPSVVTAIRENLKENIRIARLKHRQDELDNSRITLGALEDESINLQTFTTDDVLVIASKIKKARHASSTDLLKLSHAFLQGASNINCFVNATGALPVIVKEMTGNNTESQMLAMECLCNLSLGPENACEKIAQKIGTYLHTFLQSPNESLVRTSLWCLTNLIVGGKKPLKILLSQELIKGLVNVTQSTHNTILTEESQVAIELVLDYGGLPSESDVGMLSKWILSQSVPLNLGVTKIIYKLMNLVKLEPNDTTSVQTLMNVCVDTLIHMYDSSITPSMDSPSTTDTSEVLQRAILLMRICANLVGLGNNYGDYIIDNWFRPQNRSLSALFNHFIDLFTVNTLPTHEIYWLIGNLVKSQLSEPSQKYLETDEFIMRINMVA